MAANNKLDNKRVRVSYMTLTTAFYCIPCGNKMISYHGYGKNISLCLLNKSRSVTALFYCR